jgi:hypothetical protein
MPKCRLRSQAWLSLPKALIFLSKTAFSQLLRGFGASPKIRIPRGPTTLISAIRPRNRPFSSKESPENPSSFCPRTRTDEDEGLGLLSQFQIAAQAQGELGEEVVVDCAEGGLSGEGVAVGVEEAGGPGLKKVVEGLKDEFRLHFHFRRPLLFVSLISRDKEPLGIELKGAFWAPPAT